MMKKTKEEKKQERYTDNVVMDSLASVLWNL
jgi:hypothetical protein